MIKMKMVVNMLQDKFHFRLIEIQPEIEFDLQEIDIRKLKLNNQSLLSKLSLKDMLHTAEPWSQSSHINFFAKEFDNIFINKGSK